MLYVKIKNQFKFKSSIKIIIYFFAHILISNKNLNQKNKIQSCVIKSFNDTMVCD